MRAYLSTLLPKVLDGSPYPGTAFDREVPLAEAAHALMDTRQAIKVMLRP